jgi:hypothetical protein
VFDDAVAIVKNRDVADGKLDEKTFEVSESEGIVERIFINSSHKSRMKIKDSENESKFLTSHLQFSFFIKN